MSSPLWWWGQNPFPHRFMAKASLMAWHLCCIIENICPNLTTNESLRINLFFFLADPLFSHSSNQNYKETSKAMTKCHLELKIIEQAEQIWRIPADPWWEKNNSRFRKSHWPHILGVKAELLFTFVIGFITTRPPTNRLNLNTQHTHTHMYPYINIISCKFLDHDLNINVAAGGLWY